MKHIFLILFFSITSLFADVQLIQSDHPRDQGSYLWKVEAEYEKDEVALFTFRRVEKDKDGKVISDQEHYVIATGEKGTVSKQVMAVNPDHFRDVKEEDATWCIIHAHEKFFAKGKTLELLARGDVGRIKIGSFTGNTIEFTFGANAVKAEDVVKKFELGQDMLKIITSGRIWMPLPPKTMTTEKSKTK